MYTTPPMKGVTEMNRGIFLIHRAKFHGRSDINFTQARRDDICDRRSNLDQPTRSLVLKGIHRMEYLVKPAREGEQSAVTTELLARFEQINQGTRKPNRFPSFLEETTTEFIFDHLFHDLSEGTGEERTEGRAIAKAIITGTQSAVAEGFSLLFNQTRNYLNLSLLRVKPTDTVDYPIMPGEHFLQYLIQTSQENAPWKSLILIEKTESEIRDKIRRGIYAPGSVSYIQCLGKSNKFGDNFVDAFTLSVQAALDALQWIDYKDSTYDLFARMCGPFPSIVPENSQDILDPITSKRNIGKHNATQQRLILALQRSYQKYFSGKN